MICDNEQNEIENRFMAFAKQEGGLTEENFDTLVKRFILNQFIKKKSKKAKTRQYNLTDRKFEILDQYEELYGKGRT